MRGLVVAVACVMIVGCPGDDGTAESGGSGSEGTGGDSGGSTASVTSGGGSTAETTPPGDSTSAPGSTGASTGGGADVGEACQMSCEHLLSCEAVDVPNCGIPCAGIAGMVAGCENEYVAQQQCVAGLSCEDARAWSDSMSDACGSEDSAYQACISDGA